MDHIRCISHKQDIQCLWEALGLSRLIHSSSKQLYSLQMWKLISMLKLPLCWFDIFNTQISLSLCLDTCILCCTWKYRTNHNIPHCITNRWINSYTRINSLYWQWSSYFLYTYTANWNRLPFFTISNTFDGPPLSIKPFL